MQLNSTFIKPYNSNDEIFKNPFKSNEYFIHNILHNLNIQHICIANIKNNLNSILNYSWEIISCIEFPCNNSFRKIIKNEMSKIVKLHYDEIPQLYFERIIEVKSFLDNNYLYYILKSPNNETIVIIDVTEKKLITNNLELIIKLVKQ